MTPPAAKVGRLAFADAVRGLAALWVVLFHLHAGGHVSDVVSSLPPVLRAGVFQLGYLGVAAFFVLSGFVMALNVQGKRVDAQFAARFVGRRLVRLTPPYYFAIGLSIAYIAAQKFAFDPALEIPGPGPLAAHALFLQGLLAIPDINGVFWTLCVEVQFYITFALLLLLHARLPAEWGGASRAGLIFATAVLGLAWPTGLVTWGQPGTFLPYWYSFAAGALACWGWLEGGAARTLAFAICGTLLLIAFWSGSSFAWVVCLTVLALLTAALSGRMGHWLDFRWLQFLGAISYSLYLIHNIVIGSTFYIARHVLPPGPVLELVGGFFALAATLFASWLVYRVIERPCIEWSRRISVSSRRPAVGQATQPAP